MSSLPSISHRLFVAAVGHPKTESEKNAPPGSGDGCRRPERAARMHLSGAERLNAATGHCDATMAPVSGQQRNLNPPRSEKWKLEL